MDSEVITVVGLKVPVLGNEIDVVSSSWNGLAHPYDYRHYSTEVLEGLLCCHYAAMRRRWFAVSTRAVFVNFDIGHAMPHRLKCLELRNLPKPPTPLKSVNVRF